MNRQAALSLREQRKQQRLHNIEPTLTACGSTDQTIPLWQKTLLFLPLIYAAVYFIGLMYHVGYLSEFGLNPSEFQKPADLTLVKGGYSLFTTSATTTRWIPMLFVAFLFFTIVFCSTIKYNETQKIITNQRVNRWQRRVAHFFKDPSEDVKFKYMAKAIPILAQLSVLMATWLCLVMLAMLSMQSGIADAKKEKAELDLKKKIDVKITSPLLNDAPYIRITCNASHCAYWNKTGTFILRHDQVEKTFLPPKEPKKS
ncbi:hypothetical protein [Aeromonas hydrophila]|uniref:hypothetical protein n=1 Tax=Aeromonas hydrophila TaxID=644 RepID=UPI003D1F6960